MNKSNLINCLADEIIARQICPELAQQATQLVMGSGNLSADIVFIGEAPGKSEDMNGVPFVGASGKLLDALLDSINLKRDDVYITNIVKYRPPNNRDPKPAEKAEFWPYLLRQLDIIKPKLIVTLGRHAMNCFLPDAVISKEHGQASRIDLIDGDVQLSCWMMPLYHPAAALYNGSMRQTLFDDFKLILDVLTKLDNK